MAPVRRAVSAPPALERRGDRWWWRHSCQAVQVSAPVTSDVLTCDRCGVTGKFRDGRWVSQ